MEYDKLNWPGTNNRVYEFTICPINVQFNEGYEGNYIFAKFVSIRNRWEAVYIGEGDLKKRTTEHIKDGCVIRKGATHIHYRVNNNKLSRFNDETDLLLGSQEAYQPSGCNVKKGG